MQTLKNRIEKLPTLKNQPAKRQLQTATNQLRPLTDIERRPQKINFFLGHQHPVTFVFVSWRKCLFNISTR